jgi:NADH:ubiquinone oxidoreductase subunit E
MVNHSTHGNLTEKEVKKVLKQYQKAAIGEVQ